MKGARITFQKRVPEEGLEESFLTRTESHNLYLSHQKATRALCFAHPEEGLEGQIKDGTGSSNLGKHEGKAATDQISSHLSETEKNRINRNTRRLHIQYRMTYLYSRILDNEEGTVRDC
jgi:hypothetical protein